MSVRILDPARKAACEISCVVASFSQGMRQKVLPVESVGGPLLNEWGLGK